MKSKIVFKEKEKDHVDSRIRICVTCGSTVVDVYEYGISCEKCGTSVYFGRFKD